MATPINPGTRGNKTTVEIPPELLLRAKRRALDEGTNLRALIVEGLELRLARKVKKGGADGGRS
jgi:hypothetical protein